MSSAIEKLPTRLTEKDALWQHIRSEAKEFAGQEPLLGSYFHSTILNHDTFEQALSFMLADKLNSPGLPAMLIREVIESALCNCSELINAVAADILAVKERDPACCCYSTPFLYFKGFHALQSYRVAHCLWQQDRRALAYFIQNQMSAIFQVDIHPAAKIGKGVFFDHATGIVIGETAVVENNVTILQSVTLGGTGKDSGDRHPKIREGVLISTGAKVLGNIEIGEGAKIGAGSVVLQSVPPHVTVAGVPARIVGKPRTEKPALEPDQSLSD